MTTLRTRLSDDMKAAMKSGDRERLGVIRLVQAAIKQREVDERIELDDAQVLVVLEKMLKQRRDSVTQYEQAQREDLAERERFEIAVIQGYLPQPFSEAEIDAAIAAALQETGARAPADMGRVMAALKPKLAGRADMGAVSGRVRDRLTG
jgi:hypothetical protein